MFWYHIFSYIKLIMCYLILYERYWYKHGKPLMCNDYGEK